MRDIDIKRPQHQRMAEVSRPVKRRPRLRLDRLLIFLLGLALITGVAAVLGFSVVGGVLEFRQQTASESNLGAAELATRAKQQQQNGDLAGAEQSLEEALLQEDAADYRSELAVVKYRLKKYQEAIAEYEKLLAAQRDPAFAWNGIGNAYRDWASGESNTEQQVAYQDKALEAYQAAIQADSGYAVAYSNQAVLLKEIDRHSEALRVLDAGITATASAELQDLKNRL